MFSKAPFFGSAKKLHNGKQGFALTIKNASGILTDSLNFCILPYHTGTKWHERKSCHLEKLLSKRNSNYRNTPYTTNYQISKRHFPTKKYQIHMRFTKNENIPFPYTISFPNGQNANVANLKHCRPTGIPIIVIHHMHPAKTHASPPSNPPNINQRILPIVLMTTHPP